MNVLLALVLYNCTVSSYNQLEAAYEHQSDDAESELEALVSDGEELEEEVKVGEQARTRPKRVLEGNDEPRDVHHRERDAEAGHGSESMLVVNSALKHDGPVSSAARLSSARICYL